MSTQYLHTLYSIINKLKTTVFCDIMVVLVSLSEKGNAVIRTNCTKNGHKDVRKVDKIRLFGHLVVEEGGFEPPKSLTTDLQSAPFGHSGTPPYLIFGCTTVRFSNRMWSWWTDSNPRPADYKSAALPAELHQHDRSVSLIMITNRNIFVNKKFFLKRRKIQNFIRFEFFVSSFFYSPICAIIP